jgi:hypothetical protein
MNMAGPRSGRVPVTQVGSDVPTTKPHEPLKLGSTSRLREGPPSRDEPSAESDRMGLAALP